MEPDRSAYGFMRMAGTLAFGLVTVWALFMAWVSHAIAEKQWDSVAGEVGGVAIACAFLAVAAVAGRAAVRAARAGVRIDRKGVVVTGPFVTRRFDVDSVDRFESHVRGGARGLDYLVAIVLRDGTRHSINALMQSGFRRRSSSLEDDARAAADALNRKLAAARRS